MMRDGRFLNKLELSSLYTCIQDLQALQSVQRYLRDAASQIMTREYVPVCPHRLGLLAKSKNGDVGLGLGCLVALEEETVRPWW